MTDPSNGALASLADLDAVGFKPVCGVQWDMGRLTISSIAGSLKSFRSSRKISTPSSCTWGVARR
jgi:hypothetical protein